MASKEHSLRIAIATEFRRRNPDPDLIADLQRQRAAVRIADFVRKVRAEAPPLTAVQRQELAALILDAEGVAADAAA